MTITVSKEEIDELFDDAISRWDLPSYTIRWDYSGRGMYGRECIGVVTDDPTGIMVAVAYELGQRYADDLVAVFMDARYDSMGLSTIVYWPELVVTDEDDGTEDTLSSKPPTRSSGYEPRSKD